jgi:hypothetical protein
MFEWLDEAPSQHSPTFGMAASGSTTTLARMSPSWDDAERAILVALLRARPQGWRWPEIAAEVAQTGSARELWYRLVPSDLFGQTPDDHPDVTAAHSDIAAWSKAPYGSSRSWTTPIRPDCATSSRCHPFCSPRGC